MARPAGPAGSALSEPNNPHDALFRKTFSNVEHAAAELRAVLPQGLLARVDLTTLALAAGSYVDADLASSESDLLFSVELEGRLALIYVLFEHQSSVDELMPFRMLKYVVRVLERYVNAAGGGRQILPLPVVLPVVLHHSVGGWTGCTRMEDLFDSELVAEPSVALYLPRLTFVLDDISHLTDEELRDRALGMLPTLTLWALRDARVPGRIRKSISDFAGLIAALARAPSGVEAVGTIFRYLSLVADDLTPDILVATLATAGPEAEDMLMTTLAEQWKAEGLARGRSEGRNEGARLILLKLIELKFGDLPDAERRRLDDASEERVTRWAERVLTATALADVFAD